MRPSLPMNSPVTAGGVAHEARTIIIDINKVKKMAGFGILQTFLSRTPGPAAGKRGDLYPWPPHLGATPFTKEGVPTKSVGTPLIIL